MAVATSLETMHPTAGRVMGENIISYVSSLPLFPRLLKTFRSHAKFLMWIKILMNEDSLCSKFLSSNISSQPHLQWFLMNLQSCDLASWSTGLSVLAWVACFCFFFLSYTHNHYHHLVCLVGVKFRFSLFLLLSFSVSGTDMGCSGFFLSFLHPSTCFHPPICGSVCLGALLLIRVFAPSWQHMQLNSSMCYCPIPWISLCYTTKHGLKLF